MGFPSFRDLLNTVWLVFLTAIYTYIGRITVIPLVMMVMTSAVTEWIIFGWIGLTLFLLIFPVVYFTTIHYFLWGKRNPKLPEWFPTWPSWSEGLWHYAIGMLLPVGLIVLMVALTYPIHEELSPSEVEEFLESISAVTTVVWIVVAAQIFRWRRLGKKKKNP